MNLSLAPRREVLVDLSAGVSVHVSVVAPLPAPPSTRPCDCPPSVPGSDHWLTQALEVTVQDLDGTRYRVTDVNHTPTVQLQRVNPDGTLSDQAQHVSVLSAWAQRLTVAGAP
jgi:hypothetical protein